MKWIALGWPTFPRGIRLPSRTPPKHVARIPLLEPAHAVRPLGFTFAPLGRAPRWQLA